jgi:hypothetical protein
MSTNACPLGCIKAPSNADAPALPARVVGKHCRCSITCMRIVCMAAYILNRGSPGLKRCLHCMQVAHFVEADVVPWARRFWQCATLEGQPTEPRSTRQL